jgi:hypothetical protein
VIPAVAPLAETRTRRVFVPLAVLAMLIAAVGFWPGYFGPMLAGEGAKTSLVHMHAVVFVGWQGECTDSARRAACALDAPCFPGHATRRAVTTGKSISVRATLLM